MSIFVWSMVSIALWHFTIFVPDRFAGGIIGAFFAAWFGGMASGLAFGGMEVPEQNPPGFKEAVYALPGSIGALLACYWFGSPRTSELGAARLAGAGGEDKVLAGPCHPALEDEHARNRGGRA
jgi:hypothetical protein